MVEYLSSLGKNFLLQRAIGCSSPSSEYWVSTAPTPRLNASVCNTNGSWKLGLFKTGVEQSFSFNAKKALSHSCPLDHVRTLLLGEISKWCSKGWIPLNESPVIPRNTLTSFFVPGIAKVLMAKSLLSWGLTVPFPTTCPRYLHWVAPSSHFLALTVRPALRSLLKMVRRWEICSSEVALNTISSKVYSMNHLINESLKNHRSSLKSKWHDTKLKESVGSWKGCFYSIFLGYWYPTCQVQWHCWDVTWSSYFVNEFIYARHWVCICLQNRIQLSVINTYPYYSISLPYNHHRWAPLTFWFLDNIVSWHLFQLWFHCITVGMRNSVWR